MPPVRPKFLSSKKLDDFPNVESALKEPDGLLAIGGDLSCKRLIRAYQQGIFPWYEEGSPILWWSPSTRCIVIPQSHSMPKKLDKLITKKQYQITFDKSFETVIHQCAKVRHNQTWITESMMDAYIRLHHQGLAHSVEVWSQTTLVGGLYGVSLGSAFFGESMFHTESNCSKIAYHALSSQLAAWNFSLIDGQLPNDHLHRLGFEDIPRETFLQLLKQSLNQTTRIGQWHYQAY